MKTVILIFTLTLATKSISMEKEQKQEILEITKREDKNRLSLLVYQKKLEAEKMKREKMKSKLTPSDTQESEN